MVIEIVPVLARMIPSVSIVMTLVHRAFVICHREQVIHGFLSLRTWNIGSEIKVVKWELHLVIYLEVLVPPHKLKSLQTDNKHWGQLPDIYLLCSWLMLLALLAIPLILMVKCLLLWIIWETLLQSDWSVWVFLGSYGYGQVHKTIEFSRFKAANKALKSWL